jgi:hypothetical protein
MSKKFADYKYKWTSDSPNSWTPGTKPVHEVAPAPIAQNGALHSPGGVSPTASIDAVTSAANRPDSPKHPVDTINTRAK